MIKNHARHWSFFLRFPFYVALTGLVIIVILLWWGTDQYTLHKERIAGRMKAQSAQLERSLIDKIEHTAYVMELMTSQIKNRPNDLAYVNNIISKFQANHNLDNLLTWTIFSWANSSYHITVDAAYGILPKTYDLSNRDYLPRTRANPGVIQFGKPVYGSTSHRWMIPAGIGVTDNQNQYIGSLTIGFDIKTLTDLLHKEITQEAVSFILLDDEGNALLHSPGVVNLTSNEASTLFISPLGTKDSYYTHRLNHYPFVLTVMYDQKMAQHELWQAFGSRIIEISIIGTVLLALLALLYRHIVYPVLQLSQTADTIAHGNYARKMPRSSFYETMNLGLQLAKLQRSMRQEQLTRKKLANSLVVIAESDRLHDKFSRRISYEMKTPLNTIAEILEILTLYNLKNSDIPLTAQKEQEYLRTAYQAVQQLYSFITDTVQLTLVDPVVLLKECVAMQSKAAFHHQIIITQEYAADIPTLYTDKIKFTQIITGLLTRVVDFSPPGITVHLSAKVIQEDNNPLLQIILSDNGLGFDNAMRMHWNTRREEAGLGLRPDGTDFTPATITKLLEYIGGYIAYEDISSKGSIVTVTFPYHTQENQDDTPNNEIPGNVIAFRGGGNISCLK